MNVKGLKISDILNIDLDTFNNMSESDLRKITSRLVSASNKRIRRLKEHNINSPALRGMGEKEKFSTKLDNSVPKQQRVNQLRSTFAKMRGFLTSETSTIGGYKKLVKKTKQRIAKELNIPEKTLESKLNVGKLFDLLHKAQERGIVSSYRGSKGSEQARNIIAEILIDNPDANEDTIMDWLEEQTDEWYEEQEELDDETEESEL